LQALVKQGMEIRGKRVVVAGTGPLLLAVADYLRSKGAAVPVILEQATAASVRRFAMSLLRSPKKLAAGIALRARLRGSPYMTGGYPVSVVREGPELCVEFRAGEQFRRITCDYLGCGFHLVPNVELAQLLSCTLTEHGFVRVDARMRTSADGVYAIGELTGIGGVEKALVEGEIAAHAIAGEERALRLLQEKHRATIRFMHDLDRAFALRTEVKALASAETIVCRCEDVPLGALQGFTSTRDAKLQTRCGMGACQGRVCGPILRELMGPERAGIPQVRPPVIATRVGVLASICPADQPS
jgi:NADPH-dependent 2,4-dienoyl-CoA reductase/sulfur reductase-like enzyme